MKKSFLSLAVMALCVCCAVAAEPAAPAGTTQQPTVAEAPRDYDWTFIAFSFGTDIPADAATTSVYGVKIGIPARRRSMVSKGPSSMPEPMRSTACRQV